MGMRRNLRAVRNRIVRVAEALGARSDLVPTFGSSDQAGRPHIEVDERRYHFVVCERGTELERRTSSSDEEVVFWACESIASALATEYELRHRVPGQDFRRLYFARRVQLMRAVNPAWEQRERGQIERILQKHPYRDDLGA
jgi:Immunity protein 63